MLALCFAIEMARKTHVIGGTSRMQCPKVPKLTEELRMSVKLVSITFRIGRSVMTGAVMVVTRRRMAAAKRRKVPTW
jgi:hypothetical protein